MTRTLIAIALLAVPALAAGQAPARQDPSGRLYGTITTRHGNSYTGVLRWEDEEAAWGDLFNSSKEGLDYARFVPEAERRQGREIKVFGFTIGYHWDDDELSRQFVARFGDIAKLEVVGRDRVEVTMKSGTRLPVEGGSNDIGTTIVVEDASLGRMELEWSDVRTIEFAPTPPTARPDAWRIYGKVETEAGPFEGWVQWDSEECLSTDELDGETRDGDLSIPMGNIRSIEKRDRRGAWVELADGRRLLLEGTNDVDHSIRGIFVEDPRFGRVKIGWDSFERVDFRRLPGSGPAYGDFAPAGALAGTVTDRRGRKLRGRLVYDLDEAEGWELLNGNTFDVEFYIPFSRVASVVPRTSRSSVVVLRDGRELHLEDGTDVGEGHAGMLIYQKGREGAPVYVAWPDVERVDFD